MNDSCRKVAVERTRESLPREVEREVVDRSKAGKNNVRSDFVQICLKFRDL